MLRSNADDMAVREWIVTAGGTSQVVLGRRLCNCVESRKGNVRSGLAPRRPTHGREGIGEVGFMVNGMERDLLLFFIHFSVSIPGVPSALQLSSTKS